MIGICPSYVVPSPKIKGESLPEKSEKAPSRSMLSPITTTSVILLRAVWLSFDILVIILRG